MREGLFEPTAIYSVRARQCYELSKAVASSGISAFRGRAHFPYRKTSKLGNLLTLADCPSFMTAAREHSDVITNLYRFVPSNENLGLL